MGRPVSRHATHLLQMAREICICQCRSNFETYYSKEKACCKNSELHKRRRHEPTHSCSEGFLSSPHVTTFASAGESTANGPCFTELMFHPCRAGSRLIRTQAMARLGLRRKTDGGRERVCEGLSEEGMFEQRLARKKRMRCETVTVFQTRVQQALRETSVLEELREAGVASGGLGEGRVMIMTSGGWRAPDHVGPRGCGQAVEGHLEYGRQRHEISCFTFPKDPSGCWVSSRLGTGHARYW